MCFGGTPQIQQPTVDPGAAIVEQERLRIEEARRQETARQEKEAADLAAFTERLDAATGGAQTSAEQLFSSQGLDPAEFSGDISGEISRRRGFVPELDPTPALAFEGTGQTVLDKLTQALQQRTLNTINQATPTGFAVDRISSDVADPLIDELIAGQRSGAEQVAENLLSRGVITPTGFEAANRDIERQALQARPQLEQLSTGLIETGRQDLRDIANRERQRALELTLGSAPFNIEDFQFDLNKSLGDFSSDLRGDIFAQAPTDLFNVAGISNVAGFAQGAQNTRFDPRALAGILASEDEDEDDEDTSVGIF